jgi:hypothetical protein
MPSESWHRAGTSGDYTNEVIQMNELMNLDGLAFGIRDKHQAALSAAANAVSLAREAGELLIQAKGQVAHGQWAEWLKANVPFSERTAQGYMRLVRELPKLDDEKAQRVAVMPLRKALRAIADQDDVKVEYDPQLEALRIVLDIRGAIRDWNESTSILDGQKNGDISHAVFLFDQLEWKCSTRMEIYREALHRIAAAGLAYASPIYQAAIRAVSEMESLARDVAEIRKEEANA